MSSPEDARERPTPPARAFLDAAAGEPMSEVARQALAAATADGWADPRRTYSEGRRARLLLDTARESVAASLGARADEVAFTPSGTLAAHLAVLGAHAGPPGERPVGRVVVSAVEHSSVLAAAAHTGAEVEAVGVDRLGRVDLDAFRAAVARDGVRVAALQSANHEVATTQPVAEALEVCREHRVPLVVDAAQSAGRAPLPPWDLLTASAHKWGGPPGVGVLAVRRGARWRSPWPEDDGAQGRVPGAPALPLVLAAALALEAAVADTADEGRRLAALVDRVRAEVPRRVPDVEVVGDPDGRLPHLVTFSCLYVDGEALVTELDRLGFAVGSGSACTASTLRPSHVLAAMGVLTHGNVRVSLPRGTTAATVDAFLDALPGAVSRVRERAGVQGL
nr:aminotransferase class V-fold PLP-dependent enzyme [Motilibacter peucedani]